jgi:glycosyltransferase involved in cell wall biosynthesis
MLWIVAPVYNEEKNLGNFVEEWLPVFRETVGDNFVFCLINDGSVDGSLSVLQTLAARHPELLIFDKANSGHGQTCMFGYRKALESGADWIFQIDSDGQCDPADFEAFWNARSCGEVQYGVRAGREDGSARQFISGALSLFIFFLTFRWIRDTNVPYRLMNREALGAAVKSIPSHFRLANILLSLLHHENYEIIWRPIRFRQRSGRQVPVRAAFFMRESIRLFWDFLKWVPRSILEDPVAGFARLARILIGFLAGYYILVFPLLSLMRVGFFGEYDWLEGVHMAQVHRLLAGQLLYTAPSLEYTPVLYGPLYPYFATAVAFFTGESYTILRMISLVAALGSQILIWRLVVCITKSPEAAWVAAGLYAGSYAAAGYYFDGARVDSFALFFVLLHACLIWHSRNRDLWISLAAAIAGTLAVLAKQTSLAPILALSIWAFLAGGRQGRRTGVLTVTLVAVSQIVLVWISNGWFGYYLYKLPSSHAILLGNVIIFLKDSFLHWFCAGFLLSLWAIYLLIKKEKEEALFYAFFLLAMTVSSLAPRFKVGGWVNNLIPLAAVIAIGSGIAMGTAEKLRGWTAGIVLFLLLGFSCQLLYNPKLAFASGGLYRVAWIKTNLYQRVKGPVFAPCDPYWPVLEGKRDSAFWGAIIDTWMTPGEPGTSLKSQLVRAFEERKFSAVILKKHFTLSEYFPYSALEAQYRRIDSLPGFFFDWQSDYQVFVPRSDHPPRVLNRHTQN